MAGRKIKVAVVGYGYWGPNLVRNFFENPNTDILYVCDLDKNRLTRVKEKYPQIKITTDYELILKDRSVEAIVIATPTSIHYPLAKKALLAKKHIWVEKPFTKESSQAKELIGIAKKNKKIIFIDHIFLYTEAVREIKKMVEKKKLGKIYYFNSTRINLGLFQMDSNVVWDLAPHDISIMLFVMGELPQSLSVSAHSHAVKDLEDTAYISFRFKGNKSAHLHISWLSPVKIRRTLIAGTKKMLVYDDLENSDKIKVYDYGVSKNKNTKEIATSGYQYRTGNIIVPSIKSKEALQNAVDAFVESIKKGTSPISDGENGYLVVKIIESIQESLKNGGSTVEIQ